MQRDEIMPDTTIRITNNNLVGENFKQNSTDNETIENFIPANSETKPFAGIFACERKNDVLFV